MRANSSPALLAPSDPPRLHLGRAVVLATVLLIGVLAPLPGEPAARADAYSDVVVGDGATVWWRLGETGPVANDSIGTADGTYAGGTTQGVASLVAGGDGAARFNGTTGLVQIGDYPQVNESKWTTRSVELWFRPDDVTTRQVLYDEGGTKRGLGIYLEAGQVYVSGWAITASGSNPTWGPATVSAPVTVGEVYHVILVLDAPGDRFEGFLNGATMGTVTGIGPLGSHGSDNGIGAMYGSSRFDDGPAKGQGHYFDGVIDDVALYETALTPTTALNHYQTGTASGPDPGDAVAIVAAAGDIAFTNDNDEATAQLIDDIVASATVPVVVAPIGDLVYPDGTIDAFNTLYDPTWGRHRAISYPAIGNHEYKDPAAAGYYEYWGSRAGNPGEGWYRYEVANWDVYVLNSNCRDIAGRCGKGSPQESWLRAELAANPSQCIMAYWHNPIFDEVGSEDTRFVPFWDALQDAGAEFVMNAHSHYYLRSGLLASDGTPDPGGMRQFISGLGGKSIRQPTTAFHPAIEADYSDGFGILEVTLRADGYSWVFRGVDGSVPDTGTGSC